MCSSSGSGAHLAAQNGLRYSDKHLDARLVLAPLVIAAVNAQLSGHLNPLPFQRMQKRVPRLPRLSVRRLLGLRAHERATGMALAAFELANALRFDLLPPGAPCASSPPDCTLQLHITHQLCDARRKKLAGNSCTTTRTRRTVRLRIKAAVHGVHNFFTCVACNSDRHVAGMEVLHVGLPDFVNTRADVQAGSVLTYHRHASYGTCGGCASALQPIHLIVL